MVSISSHGMVMVWSRSTRDMYHDVDIPSPLEVSIESYVDSLRAMRTCLFTGLLIAYRDIHLLTRWPLSSLPSYVSSIISGR